MTEPEVSLYVALYFIRNGLTEKPVEVSIDGAHVKIKGNVHFDIQKFFDDHEFIKLDPNEGKWQGEYKVGQYDVHIIVHSNHGNGDVKIYTLDGKTMIVESKKGKENKSGQEYQLMHEAIGQLLTSPEFGDTIEYVVAVPFTEKSKKLADQWSRFPRIKNAGIKFFLVKEDGNLEIISNSK